MTDPKPYDLPRVLVVCNSTALRRAFGELLYEMLVESHWHLQVGGVAEYAAWCQPHVIVLALRDTADNLTAYEALTVAYGDSAAVRVGLLGVPQDGVVFPSPRRLQLDSYLPPPPSLHELAWLVGRATDARGRPPAAPGPGRPTDGRWTGGADDPR